MTHHRTVGLTPWGTRAGRRATGCGAEAPSNPGRGAAPAHSAGLGATAVFALGYSGAAPGIGTDTVGPGSVALCVLTAGTWKTVGSSCMLGGCGARRGASAGSSIFGLGGAP